MVILYLLFAVAIALLMMCAIDRALFGNIEYHYLDSLENKKHTCYNKIKMSRLDKKEKLLCRKYY